MTYRLDLDDIQGNIIRAYGRYSYPFARYYFLNISDPAKGRAFVGQVAERVTTAVRWPNEAARPQCTVNIGFTFFGLYRLNLSQRTLRSMPEEFIAGMKDRAFLLGDRDQTKTEAEAAAWDAHWDPIWQGNRRGDGYDDDNVHIWISMNAQQKEPGVAEPVAALEETAEWLKRLCDESGGGVKILGGHGRDGSMDHQPASAVFNEIGGVMVPTPTEHFGFADGIGDPVFAGQYPPEEEKTAVIGRGKRLGHGWVPLATGEFVLGHPDESQELPPTAAPAKFMRNGSFMAYRKLHEKVGSFSEVIRTEGERFARVRGVSQGEAEATLCAKLCGRWVDGIPLAVAPDFESWTKLRGELGFDVEDPLQAFKNQIDYLKSPASSDFRYADDMPGYKTPSGAHLRRVNTRDYLDPLNTHGVDADGIPHRNEKATTQLNKRRRILRRGLPYGPPHGVEKTDDTEQGVAMMVVAASLFRQFEFVQQQWIQYGLDFNQGNDTCPMLGNHEVHKRFTIQSDPKSGKAPYVMSGLKTFVECRGGDYFFLPSLSALRQLAMGVVDPT
ncbi:peroxidase [Sulfitobacter sp. D35]|uniref:Dyp-type peroxidase n=1 Tax=Sulfitobacter sp. D35 TaxID=3083252 RepID=UPI00296ED1A6|nr:peroxidase [Sulfitobacter sp. D35]MDW4498775.1 peroxidase [Sulfitobacter sp. D35]